MNQVIRAALLIIVLCMGALGLLFVMGVVSGQFFTDNGAKILAGTGVLLVVAVAIAALGKGQGPDKTDPPIL